MHKIHNFSLKNAGVTLVELLVALMVASLIMLPIILLFGVSERVTYKTINEVVASNLALQKIEELRSQPFENLRRMIEERAPDQIDGPFSEIELPLELNGIWNTPGVEYARQAKLSFFPHPSPDPSRPDYELQKRRIRIRVIIRFIERALGGVHNEREKTFELASMVSDETLGSGLNATFTLPLNTP